MNKINKNVLAVISGPSGVGKGTVIKRMFELCPGLCESVSCTTRAPREGEQDGREYFFVSRERFEQMIEGGELLEYSAHFDNYYGTPKAFVEEKLKTGDVILEIDVVGGAHNDSSAKHGRACKKAQIARDGERRKDSPPHSARRLRAFEKG